MSNKAELRADLQKATTIALDVTHDAIAKSAKDFELLQIELAAAKAGKAELAEALRHLVHNIKATGKRLDLGLAVVAAESALKRNGCKAING